MPRLVASHPNRAPQVLELSGDRPISIGRARSSDLVLDGAGVSRLHGVVRHNPEGRWEIIDRSSANGLTINGRTMKEGLLGANDEICIANFKLRFEDSAERKIMSYGTANLPGSVAKLAGELSYSGSFLPAEPLSNALNGGPATVAAASLSRMQTLEEENRLLKVLYRVNMALGQVENVDDLACRILDLVLEVPGAERAYSMQLDDGPNAKQDFAKGSYAFKPAVIRYRGNSSREAGSAPQLIISQTIIRQVMQGGLPLLVTDGQADPRFAATASIVNAGIQSAMCAPLGASTHVRGLLYVDNLSKRGMFTVEQLNIFAVIAVQAGLAIDRLQGVIEPVELAH